MRAFAIPTLIFLAAAASGCAPVPDMADPAERLACPGFSILQPKGDGWFILPLERLNHPAAVMLKESRCARVFAKLLAPKGEPKRIEEAHALVAIAWLIELKGRRFPFGPEGPSEEYLRFVERLLRERFPPRLRPLEWKFSLDGSPGVNCVRYDISIEDRGLAALPSAAFISTMRGLMCPHPDSPRFHVNVVYSQRHLRGESPLPMEEEGEPFLRSLRFTPLGGEFHARAAAPLNKAF